MAEPEIRQVRNLLNDTERRRQRSSAVLVVEPLVYSHSLSARQRGGGAFLPSILPKIEIKILENDTFLFLCVVLVGFACNVEVRVVKCVIYF